MIQPERIRKVKDCDLEKGSFVLYWMQSAQRVKNNHALEFATQYANTKGLPLVVCLVLMPEYPSANKRHYRFMLQGLESLSKAIGQIGAHLVVQYGEAMSIIHGISKEAVAVVMDDAISKPMRHMKESIARQLETTVYQVETNVIVPVKTAYPKEAYAAYAIRNALNRQLHAYAIDFRASKVANIDCRIPMFESVETLDPEVLLQTLFGHLPDLKGKDCLIGGEEEALRILEDFIHTKLETYTSRSSDPSVEATSKLSAYLHFGQISPITIHEAVKNSGIASGAFIEQLFVRRELAYNFVGYNDHYDSDLKKFLPDWAIAEMAIHESDPRMYHYTKSQLEDAQTHDPYWNAAQQEMVLTGFMHNTMRMYWGKKIIEWTDSYEEAFKIMLEFNDKYSIDGRDPNGYAGIAWCFGKHDRPFSSRPIFGKIRYMNDKGLERKYKMKGYLDRIKDIGGRDATL